MARWIWFVQIDTERDRHLLWAIIGVVVLLVILVGGLVSLAVVAK